MWVLAVILPSYATASRAEHSLKLCEQKQAHSRRACLNYQESGLTQDDCSPVREAGACRAQNREALPSIQCFPSRPRCRLGKLEHLAVFGCLSSRSGKGEAGSWSVWPSTSYKNWMGAARHVANRGNMRGGEFRSGKASTCADLRSARADHHKLRAAPATTALPPQCLEVMRHRCISRYLLPSHAGTPWEVENLLGP